MVRAKRKQHIKDFKKAILRYVKDNAKKLAKTFIPAQKPEYLDKALIDTNWVQTDKYFPVSYNYEIVHEFNCKPYGTELKAYVYTTKDGFEIENVIVQTE